eukprot:symbB.v1.2.038781.t1/scaffold6170.1/size20375/3
MDGGSSVQLSELTQQAARTSYQELCAANETADLQAALQRAKGRFLRLSLLLSNCDDASGLAALEPVISSEPSKGVPLGPSVLGDELGAAQWRRLLGLRASLARSKVAE